MDSIQAFLQKADILRVAFEHGIAQVAKKRDESNEKVQENVKYHPKNYAPSQFALNLGTDVSESHRHDQVQRVAETALDVSKIGAPYGLHSRGNQADDAAPAEADAEQIEERHVEMVGPFADPSQDDGVVFGNVVGNLLLDLSELAFLVWNHCEVRILSQVSVYDGRGNRKSGIVESHVVASHVLLLVLVELAAEHLLGRILADKTGHCGRDG